MSMFGGGGCLVVTCRKPLRSQQPFKRFGKPWKHSAVTVKASPGKWPQKEVLQGLSLSSCRKISIIEPELGWVNLDHMCRVLVPSSPTADFLQSTLKQINGEKSKYGFQKTSKPTFMWYFSLGIPPPHAHREFSSLSLFPWIKLCLLSFYKMYLSFPVVMQPLDQHSVACSAWTTV